MVVNNHPGDLNPCQNFSRNQICQLKDALVSELFPLFPPEKEEIIRPNTVHPTTYLPIQEYPSIRDWYVAHAPETPQPWFSPSMPTKPELGEGEDPGDGHPGFYYPNLKNVQEWEKEQAKQLLLQWPHAWADEMMKLRK